MPDLEDIPRRRSDSGVILADTSIWVDHFRRTNREFSRHLGARNVLMHPLVACELAMGHLSRREQTLRFLDDLPPARTAHQDEVRDLIESKSLFGRGIGAIDVHLLASALMSQPCELWTLDKRLKSAALEAGLKADL